MRQRLVVVSNRLPFVFKQEDGAGTIEPGNGGLVSALTPVLRQNGGMWIGWPGTTELSPELRQTLSRLNAENKYSIHDVQLDADEVRDFYQGFSNEVIWPLFHDLQSSCNFNPAYWETYCSVNKKYAQRIFSAAAAEDFVWVHDYHLMNVARDLHALGGTSTTGFFLHIPFPSVDIYAKLPWRKQLIEAMLHYDLIGFQTLHDSHNFAQCVRAYTRDFHQRRHGRFIEVRANGRKTRIGAFPISIDFNELATEAASPPVQARAQEIRNLLPSRTLALGIDRLDYTKGIPHRLKAFHRLLKQHPEMREKISLIQVVVPSRVEIPEYDDLKASIEQLVGNINGDFGRPGVWQPVWYVYGTLTRVDLLAYYRAADIALVTPLRDGMNLVAKEFCACSIEENCTLILSEFAGAAAKLKTGALLVNPYDVDGVSEALRSACLMPRQERVMRMRGLRETIRRQDVFSWANSFLDAVPRAVRREMPAAHPRQSGESMAMPVLH